MELRQIISGVQKHADEALTELMQGHEDAASDCLAEAAGLIQREIGASDEHTKSEPEQEEKTETLGQDQQAEAEKEDS